MIDIINKNPRVFNNVKYYVSSPWYDAAKAEIKNVKEVDFPPKGKRTIINGVSDIHYDTSMYRKICSPPHCCDVFLCSPRLFFFLFFFYKDITFVPYT